MGVAQPQELCPCGLASGGCWCHMRGHGQGSARALPIQALPHLPLPPSCFTPSAFVPQASAATVTDPPSGAAWALGSELSWPSCLRPSCCWGGRVCPGDQQLQGRKPPPTPSRCALYGPALSAKGQSRGSRDPSASSARPWGPWAAMASRYPGPWAAGVRAPLAGLWAGLVEHALVSDRAGRGL